MCAKFICSSCMHSLGGGTKSSVYAYLMITCFFPGILKQHRLITNNSLLNQKLNQSQSNYPFMYLIKDIKWFIMNAIPSYQVIRNNRKYETDNIFEK